MRFQSYEKKNRDRELVSANSEILDVEVSNLIKFPNVPYLLIWDFWYSVYVSPDSETKSSDTSKIWSINVLVPQRAISNLKSPIPELLNSSDFTLKVLTLYNFLRTMIKARLESITFNHILQKCWPQLKTESIVMCTAKRSSTLLVLFMSLNIAKFKSQ